MQSDPREGAGLMNRSGKPEEVEVEGDGVIPGYFPMSGRSISGSEASWGGGSPAHATAPDPQAGVQSGSGAAGHGQVINEVEESPASRSGSNDLEALACVVGFHHSQVNLSLFILTGYWALEGLRCGGHMTSQKNTGRPDELFGAQGHNVEWTSFPGCDVRTQEWKNLAFLALPEVILMSHRLLTHPTHTTAPCSHLCPRALHRPML